VQRQCLTHCPPYIKIMQRCQGKTQNSKQEKYKEKHTKRLAGHLGANSGELKKGYEQAGNK